jgi:mannose-1-phosphate guanylyltransferase
MVLVMASTIYTVILAGGRGKRLWPLSRHTLPKQLITLGTGRTLLDLTIERISLVTSYERRCLVTVGEYLPALKEMINDKVSLIIKEPCGRNTAAAIALATLTIYKEDPEAIIFFVPSDHLIADNAAFVSCVDDAFSYAACHDELLLFGIKPAYPATDYGYIEHMGSEAGQKHARILRFHEKPSKDSALRYCQVPCMLWNSGMVMGRASVFMNAFQRYAPLIYQGIQQYMQGHEDAYTVLPDCSFDHAVLEYAENMVVFPANFGWSDVGTLASFLAADSKYMMTSSTIEIESQRNALYSRTTRDAKVAIFLGVDDLCVIEMDDLIFVSRCDESDRIKQVVDYLQKQGHREYI